MAKRALALEMKVLGFDPFLSRERAQELGIELVDTVAAISVGMKDGEVLVDLDYDEDSTCEVDMNFVVTGKDLFIEVQGTAERQAFSEEDLKRMTEGAKSAIRQLRQIQLSTLVSRWPAWPSWSSGCSRRRTAARRTSGSPAPWIPFRGGCFSRWWWRAARQVRASSIG